MQVRETVPFKFKSIIMFCRSAHSFHKTCKRRTDSEPSLILSNLIKSNPYECQLDNGEPWNNASIIGFPEGGYPGLMWGNMGTLWGLSQQI